MRVYTIRVDGMGFTVQQVKELALVLEEDLPSFHPDNKVEIEIHEMTEAEYSALPEFQGW